MGRRIVLTEQERELIAVWRAFRAYQRPPGTADAWLELHADGSGFLVVDPADVNRATFHAATWKELEAAGRAVEDARRARRRRRRAIAAVNRRRT